ncbi:MAG: adenylate kinase [Patescibacteria group bacterium]
MAKFICLYGLPACGKTTQAELLSKELGMTQFGMGDRLRAEVESGSELGQRIKTYVDQGTLIPDEMMHEIINNVSAEANPNGIIFDGFPRKVSQAEMLDKIANQLGTPIKAFFYIKVGAQEVVKRIGLRAETGDREDDKDPAIVQTRIDVFVKESEPLMAYYRQQGKLIEIDGEQTIEQVFEEIKKFL